MSASTETETDAYANQPYRPGTACGRLGRGGGRAHPARDDLPRPRHKSADSARPLLGRGHADGDRGRRGAALPHARGTVAALLPAGQRLARPLWCHSLCTDGGKWRPRYYQHNAIVAVLDAITRGQRRILLTLATGDRQDLHCVPDCLECSMRAGTCRALRCGGRACCAW